jgi:hypothetical protein
MLEELRDRLPAGLSLDYRHVQAAPQSNEAKASHPMGKIPSLLVQDPSEGEFTLIESAAINNWLGDRMREYCCHEVGSAAEEDFLVPKPVSAATLEPTPLPSPQPRTERMKAAACREVRV